MPAALWQKVSTTEPGRLELRLEILATIGPGAINLVNVVANALQDQVPMVVITGCADPAEAVTYTHHDR